MANGHILLILVLYPVSLICTYIFNIKAANHNRKLLKLHKCTNILHVCGICTLEYLTTDLVKQRVASD